MQSAPISTSAFTSVTVARTSVTTSSAAATTTTTTTSTTTEPAPDRSAGQLEDRASRQLLNMPGLSPDLIDLLADEEVLRIETPPPPRIVASGTHPDGTPFDILRTERNSSPTRISEDPDFSYWLRNYPAASPDDSPPLISDMFA